MKSIVSVLAIIALGLGLSGCPGGGGGGGGGSSSAFAVSTTSADFGVVDNPYTSKLASTGGTAPFTWAEGGGLPAGLSLNASTGVVSGKPTVDGNSTVVFTVMDSTGQTATGSVLFAIHPRTDILSVNNSTPPVPGSGVSTTPSISADGRIVAFVSSASLLSSGGVGTQIYVHDWQTNQTTLISQNGTSASPIGGNGASSAPSISGDGRFVAFVSGATDLLPAGSPVVSGQQIYVNDRQLGVTSLVSSDNLGNAASGGSIIGSPSISGNGRFIAFVTDANLGATGQQIYLRDTQGSGPFPNGQTIVMSKDNTNPTPIPGNGNSTAPSISSDGCFVAFASVSTNLLLPAPGNQQIYVRGPLAGPGTCLGTEQTSLVSQDTVGNAGNGASSQPTISGDGQFVAFTSLATTLVATLGGSGSQIFLRDTKANATSLVSQDTGGTVGNGASNQPTISADGRFVAFTSVATLALTPGGSGTQIFLRDTQSSTTTLVSQDSGGNAGNGASSAASINGNGGFVAFSSLADFSLGAAGSVGIFVRAIP